MSPRSKFIAKAKAAGKKVRNRPTKLSNHDWQLLGYQQLGEISGHEEDPAAEGTKPCNHPVEHHRRDDEQLLPK